jgi:hypothetical protein
MPHPFHEDDSSIQVGEISLCRNPIFIIGAQRSGTSMLARALGEHRALWYSIEGQIFHRLLGHQPLGEVYRSLTRKDWYWMSRERVSREEFCEAVGLGLNALYTNRSGGLRWVEKLPENTFIAETLAGMFPGASFIHILRDGRFVVNSMVNKADAPRWQRDFGLACRDWREFTRAAVDFSERHPQRCLTIRNEHLTADPGSVFAKIFGFLGLTHEDGPIEFFRSKRINSSFTQQPGGTPPDPWVLWTPSQRQIFLDEAGDTMVQHGLASREEIQALRSDVAKSPGFYAERISRHFIRGWDRLRNLYSAATRLEKGRPRY